MTTTMTINANRARELAAEAEAKAEYARAEMLAKCLHEAIEPMVEEAATKGNHKVVVPFEVCDSYVEKSAHAIVLLIRANGFVVDEDKHASTFAISW